MATSPRYAGTHSWEIFEQVPAEVLRRRGPGRTEGSSTTPTIPWPAATIVPLREGPSGLEVWLMRRHRSLVFGGFWVFPGGKVDPVDQSADDPLIAAAIREMQEETGLTLEPDQLIRWAHWITPEGLKIRFDTHFYLCQIPEGVEPDHPGDEADRATWRTITEILDEDRTAPDDQIALIPPTRTTLWELALLGSWAAITTAAEQRVIEPVLARWFRDGDDWGLSHPRRDGTWT